MHKRLRCTVEVTLSRFATPAGAQSWQRLLSLVILSLSKDGEHRERPATFLEPLSSLDDRGLRTFRGLRTHGRIATARLRRGREPRALSPSSSAYWRHRDDRERGAPLELPARARKVARPPGNALVRRTPRQDY